MSELRKIQLTKINDIVYENTVSLSPSDIKKTFPSLKLVDIEIIPIANRIIIFGKKFDNDVITQDDINCIKRECQYKTLLQKYLGQKYYLLWQELITISTQRKINDKKRVAEKVIEKKTLFELNNNIKDFYNENNKEKELDEFLLAINEFNPNNETLFNLKALFDIADSIIINKYHEYPVSLYVGNHPYVVEDYKEFLDQMLLIRSFNSKDDLNLFNKHSQSSFLKMLCEIDTDGVGEMEFMITYLLKGASIQGGSKPHDIEITHDSYIENIELKSHNDMCSIRLGTNGNITNFKFYDRIKDISEKISLVLECIDHKVLDEDTMKFFKYVHFECYPSFLKGEFTKHLRHFKTICFEVNKLLKSSDKQDYILSRSNEETCLYTIFGEDDEYNQMTSILSNCVYAIHPEQLDIDLEDSVQEYFKTSNLSCLIINRMNVLHVLPPSEFRFANISQNSIKIMEVQDVGIYNKKES